MNSDRFHETPIPIPHHEPAKPERKPTPRPQRIMQMLNQPPAGSVAARMGFARHRKGTVARARKLCELRRMGAI